MMKQQDVFKALADPTRRKILAMLKQQAMTAGDIAARFDITRASLSHHFNVLKQANLVTSERQGQQMLYAINTRVFDDTATLMMGLFGQQK